LQAGWQRTVDLLTAAYLSTSTSLSNHRIKYYNSLDWYSIWL